MAQPLRVYWRPGCSSCVKVKEFLTGLGVGYESINISSTPQAMEELRELGISSVPVVVRGRDYVYAQELADVSRFVGKTVEFQRLPAPMLVGKWLAILQKAQRQIAQIPPQRLEQPAIEGRERSVRELACHIFQVPDAFLQAVEKGVEDLAAIYNAPPPAEVRTSADIGAYGAVVTAHLQRWWDGVGDKSCAGQLRTDYGVQPLHHVLERCTWHSAQHARQIQAVLQQLGIQPEDPLTEKDYAGLPMPVGLWE